MVALVKTLLCLFGVLSMGESWLMVWRVAIEYLFIISFIVFTLHSLSLSRFHSHFIFGANCIDTCQGNYSISILVKDIFNKNE